MHRLDKDTSGIIIITKNINCKKKLKEMFKKRNIKKNYLAFTYGVMNKNNFEVNKNISRNKFNITKFNVSDNLGKNAITKVSNIKIFHGSISLLDCEIITGRTHQIRVHLLSLGLPIIGDKDYIFDKEQKFRMNNSLMIIKIYCYPFQDKHYTLTK